MGINFGMRTGTDSAQGNDSLIVALVVSVLSNPPDNRPTAFIFVFDLMFVTAVHI